MSKIDQLYKSANKANKERKENLNVANLNPSGKSLAQASAQEVTAASPSAVASTKPSLLRPLLLLASLALILLLAPQIGVQDRLRELSIWLQQFGYWAPLVFISVYIVAVVAALPGSVLTAAAGALFGSLWGTVYVSIAATIGAGLAFLVSRYLARASIAKWLQENEKFKRLDAMVEKQGAVIVALTRLVPLFPFNLLNYGFGLTSVRFSTYLFWSWLCMLPGTVLYVVGTDVVVTGLKEGGVPWPLLGVLALAVVLVSLVAVVAKRRLAQKD